MVGWADALQTWPLSLIPRLDAVLLWSLEWHFSELTSRDKRSARKTSISCPASGFYLPGLRHDPLYIYPCLFSFLVLSFWTCTGNLQQEAQDTLLLIDNFPKRNLVSNSVILYVISSTPFQNYFKGPWQEILITKALCWDEFGCDGVDSLHSSLCDAEL